MAKKKAAKKGPTKKSRKGKSNGSNGIGTSLDAVKTAVAVLVAAAEQSGIEINNISQPDRDVDTFSAPLIDTMAQFEIAQKALKGIRSDFDSEVELRYNHSDLHQTPGEYAISVKVGSSRSVSWKTEAVGLGEELAARDDNLFNEKLFESNIHKKYPQKTTHKAKIVKADSPEAAAALND